MNTSDRKRHLVTQKAERRIRETRPDIDTLKHDFGGSLEHIDGVLTEHYAQAYRLFEADVRSDIDSLLSEVSRAREAVDRASTGTIDSRSHRYDDATRVGEWDKESAQNPAVSNNEGSKGSEQRFRYYVEAHASFDRVCKEAYEVLVDAIRSAAAVWRVREEERKTRDRDLLAGQHHILKKIEKATVALTGIDQGSVPPPRTFAAWLLVAAALTLFLGIEFVVGTPFFEFISNRIVATVLSFATILFGMFLVYVAANAWKRRSAARDAEQTFEETYRRGHPEGYVVQSPSSADRQLTTASTVALLALVVVLLGSRFWISSQESFDDIGGVIGVVGLFFCFLTYGVLEYLLAYPYAGDALADFREAQQALAENQAHLQENAELSVEARDLFDQASKVAKDEYESVVATARNKFSNMEVLEEKRINLLAALEGYGLAWESFRAAVFKSSSDLASYVATQSQRAGSSNGGSGASKIFLADAGRLRRYRPEELIMRFRDPFQAVTLPRRSVNLRQLKSDALESVARPLPQPQQQPEISQVPSVCSEDGRLSSNWNGSRTGNDNKHEPSI